MVDTKISSFPDAVALDPTDIITVVTEVGVLPTNRKITYSVFKSEILALANAQYVTGKTLDGLSTWNLIGVDALDHIQVGDNTNDKIEYRSAGNHDFISGGVTLGGWYTGGINLAGGRVYRATSPNSSYYLTLSHNGTDALLTTTFGKISIPETINVNGEDLTNTLIGQWNTAYSWGDHAGLYSPIAHTHELASLDATGATDGHVLTADGAGGAAWEPSAAGGFASADTFEYTWSTTTTTSPGPAVGIIRVNNANYASVTKLQFSETDANGNNILSRLQHLIYTSSGNTPVKGLKFRIVAKNDPTRWIEYTNTTVNDFGTYWDLSGDVFHFNGALVDAETVLVQHCGPHIEMPWTDGSLLTARTSVSYPSGSKEVFGWLENRRVRTSLTSSALYFFAGPTISSRCGGIEFSEAGVNQDTVLYQGDPFSTGESGRMTFSMSNTTGVLEIAHRNGGARRFQFAYDNLQIGWSGSGSPTDGGVIYIKQIGVSPKGNLSNCGQVWVNDNIDLMYTDSSGNTTNLSNPGATGGSWSTGWSTTTGGSITIAANAPLFYNEQADDDNPGAGQGQVWVRNDTPNVLVFTDDALTNFDISANQLLANYRIKSNSLAPTGTTETLTYSDGPAFELDLESVTDNTTVTLAGAPTSGTYGEFIVKVNQDSAVARTITWAGGTFRWEGGTPHAVTTTLDGWSIFRFETWDGGTTYYARGADYS